MAGLDRSVPELGLSQVLPESRCSRGGGVRGAVDRFRLLSGVWTQPVRGVEPESRADPVTICTHEIGPLLGPRWPNRYGKQGEKQVQRDMVFTIEPSVTSKFGTCNLEQDVLVTSTGYQELSKPQDEIIQLG